MNLTATLRGVRYRFGSLSEVLAKANAPKAGDQLAGLAARDPLERIAARAVLADITLAELRAHPVLPYEQDELSRLAEDTLDEAIFAEIKPLTVGGFREWLLGAEPTRTQSLAPGLTPEMVAGVCKLLSNLELMLIASRLEVQSQANSTLGLRGTLGARIQPNHPTDAVEGVLLVAREGLSWGCGDALIGVNPANDSLETTTELLHALHGLRARNELPTQVCVLSHASTQMKALEAGVPVDILASALAGGQEANRRLGVSVALIDEAHAMMQELGQTQGPNRLYFETGQGLGLQPGQAPGADQLTLHARACGFARRYRPFLVNTVGGAVGPEYLEDGVQITRAALEDHLVGKLLGLPMGNDACMAYHSHMGQDELESLKVLLTQAGVTSLMALPMGEDVLRGYQSSSFHDIASLRQLSGKQAAPEFQAWAEARDILWGHTPGPRLGDPTAIR